MLNKLRTTVLQIKGQRHQGVGRQTQVGHLSCFVKVKLNRFYCSLVNLGKICFYGQKQLSQTFFPGLVRSGIQTAACHSTANWMC